MIFLTILFWDAGYIGLQDISPLKAKFRLCSRICTGLFSFGSRLFGPLGFFKNIFTYLFILPNVLFVFLVHHNRLHGWRSLITLM